MAMLEVLPSGLHLILAVGWQAGRQKFAGIADHLASPQKKAGPKGPVVIDF